MANWPWKAISPIVLPLVFAASFTQVSASAQESLPTSIATEASPTAIEDYAASQGMTIREVFAEASKELQAAGFEHEDFVTEEGVFSRYSLGEEGALTFPHPVEYENRARGGFEGGQFWVELTPFEQKAIATGAGAAAAAVICAAGPAACAVASAASAVMSLYIGERGVCPNNQRLTMYFVGTHIGRSYCGNK